jgi:peptidylprolyl isomerase
MEIVENGLFAQVHYKGTLADGEVFDSSLERGTPLEIAMGKGQMIKGFEQALLGMAVKEKKTFTLPPEEAYGNRDDSLERSFKREQIPLDFNPEVGQILELRSPQGRVMNATIVTVDDQQVTLDLNHPLAGQSLTFEIEVVGITDTSTQTPAECGDGCGCDCSTDSCG